MPGMAVEGAWCIVGILFLVQVTKPEVCRCPMGLWYLYVVVGLHFAGVLILNS